MDGWPRRRYERRNAKGRGDVVGNERRTDRAARDAGDPREPVSLVRRCAILALGGTAMVIDASSRLLDEARAAAVEQITTWSESVQRMQARLLGRRETKP